MHMLLTIKIKLSFHKEIDFYCWLLAWLISSL